MKIKELKDSVSGIHMQEEMRRAVIDNIKERTGQTDGERTAWSADRKQADRKPADREQADRKPVDGKPADHTGKRKAGWQKNLAAAAVVFLAIGAVSVPVRALVNSVIKERVEEMPQEEKDTYVETLKEQKAEADGMSREYTENEKARYQEMARKYQEGTFPEQAVIQVDSEEEAQTYEFCYLKPASMFCLPKRELTDEEILEIIDFTVKREYAHRESYAQEHEEELAAKEEKEQAKIAQNVESGGITEQEAVEIATGKLSEIFGITEEGFERNSYYNEEEDGRAANYCVNWCNIISHQFYYFYIDAEDGHMTWAAHSGEDIRREILVSVEVEEKLPQLQRTAVAFMEEMIGESYSDIYVYYLRSEDGMLAGDGVRFYFARENQEAWAVAYTWDGTLYEVEERSVSDLEDGSERKLWKGKESIKFNVVFRKLTGEDRTEQHDES